MKVALTIGVLQVPPTYFALSHAQALQTAHDFSAFALAADIRDESVTVPVHDAIGLRQLDFATRMRLAPLSTQRMTRALRAFQPDVIHQHFATWSSSATTVARDLNVPLLTTIHGYDVFVALRHPRTALERWHGRNVHRVQARSTRVLAVSRYLADQAVRAGFDSSRLEVHYQGVDTDYFTLGPEGGLRDNVPVVTFVGALNEMKGVRDLITASRAILPSLEHRLVIVGAGPLASQLRTETAADTHIDFLGPLRREAVRLQLQRSAVLVLPTKTEDGRSEAAGLVLLEAQACGTPVIAYESGGTPEMMEPGVTGLLVSEGDVRDLGHAIRDILSLSDGDYGRFSAAARAFTVTERSFAGSAQKLNLLYDELSH